MSTYPNAHTVPVTATDAFEILAGPFGPSPPINFVLFFFNSGNIGGQSPYVSGTPCSQCAEDVPFCDANLCSKYAGIME